MNPVRESETERVKGCQQYFALMGIARLTEAEAERTAKAMPGRTVMGCSVLRELPKCPGRES